MLLLIHFDNYFHLLCRMDTSLLHTQAFLEQEEDTEMGHHNESYESDGDTTLAFENANGDKLAGGVGSEAMQKWRTM